MNVGGVYAEDAIAPAPTNAATQCLARQVVHSSIHAGCINVAYIVGKVNSVGIKVDRIILNCVRITNEPIARFPSYDIIIVQVPGGAGIQTSVNVPLVADHLPL